jgi:hypothetical protein
MRTKNHEYYDEHACFIFTCSAEHRSQRDLCYETLCYGNMELTRRHWRLQTNYKEHIITPGKLFCSRGRKF